MFLFFFGVCVYNVCNDSIYLASRKKHIDDIRDPFYLVCRKKNKLNILYMGNILSYITNPIIQMYISKIIRDNLLSSTLLTCWLLLLSLILFSVVIWFSAITIINNWCHDYNQQVGMNGQNHLIKSIICLIINILVVTHKIIKWKKNSTSQSIFNEQIFFSVCAFNIQSNLT